MSQLSRGQIVDLMAEGESLRGANLVRADLSRLDLAQIDMAEANLRMADLSRSDLREARLTGCFLSGATLNGANLVGANLVEASLIGAMLKEANLSRADFSGADLTGAMLEDAQLSGTYLVGAFLNEADLSRANLSGAYIRMSQMAGSNLKGAVLEGADLSQSDLSGARLDNACLVGANLSGVNLSSGTLAGCDLREADLTGADLSGCDLTGAKLRGIKSDGAKLDDAWAEWVNLGSGDKEEPASLEDVFGSVTSKPLAQVLVDGRVEDEVWAVILAHLFKFQNTHPQQADVSLKAIYKGMSSSALYLEAEEEISLASYLSEFADLVGKGCQELFDKLTGAGVDLDSSFSGPLSSPDLAATQPLDDAPVLPASSDIAAPTIEALQYTAFWNSDKAFVILTSRRSIWLEASSSDTLTIRPPHNINFGIEIIQGRFVSKAGRQFSALANK